MNTRLIYSILSICTFTFISTLLSLPNTTLPPIVNVSKKHGKRKKEKKKHRAGGGKVTCLRKCTFTFSFAEHGQSLNHNNPTHSIQVDSRHRFVLLNACPCNHPVLLIFSEHNHNKVTNASFYPAQNSCNLPSPPP